MLLTYTVKHLFRSWKLFLALLIGIILASAFFAGKIGGDEYVERRQSLKQMKDSLREELQRMGVTT
jgi:uncharacterized protein YneF (UPF0154 family)